MSQSWHIAMFVGQFPVVSETFILRQITGLMDLGHQVDIYADARGDAAGPLQPEVERYRLLEHCIWMDAPLEVIPYEMPLWPLHGRTWPPGAAKSVPNSLRLARALPKLLRGFTANPRLARELLRPAEYGFRATSLSGLYRLAKLAESRSRYDVLHAHFGPTGNSFRFARQLWRAPLVVSFHGYDFCTVPRKEGAQVYDRLFATADLMTANSRYTRSRLEALGCPTAKIRLLPVGLDVKAFAFRERSLAGKPPLRILSIGRLVEIKGQEYLLRAVARLRDGGLPVRGDLVGDGPLRAKLESLAKELDLADVVTFHGALAGPAIQELLAAAHVFVLPSVSVNGDGEGQGLVVQEAQACGLPVVVTAPGALPEGMLDGQSGWVVPERDAAALAERLADLAAHPERWPAMGRTGRQFVEQYYDLPRLNQRLVELYGEARRLRFEI